MKDHMTHEILIEPGSIIQFQSQLIIDRNLVIRPHGGATEPAVESAHAGRRLNPSTAPQVTLDGMDRSRMFIVAPCTNATLEGLRMVRGTAGFEAQTSITNPFIGSTFDYEGRFPYGGAIINYGDLTMIGCAIERCKAPAGYGGAIASGVFEGAVLRMTDCVLRECEAYLIGGAIIQSLFTVSLTRCLIENNKVVGPVLAYHIHE